MRLGILFSGGKDSCAALALAQSYGHEVVCLLTLESQNPASYMFHTPNIRLTQVQAEAIGIPLLTQTTRGEKEVELEDLDALLVRAKRDNAIDGVVTGAIGSIYQATRVQVACAKLGLAVFNPLWQRDERNHMRWLLENGFEIVISGIAAYPLDEKWLGRRIDEQALDELERLQDAFGLSPAGEGGEIETLVLYAPGWRRRLVVDESSKEYENNAGTWHVTKSELVDAKEPETKVARLSAPTSHGKSPRNEKKTNEKVLIVNLCQETLSEPEFIHPIIRAIGTHCTIRQHSEVKRHDIGKAAAIILSGTPLQDDAFLEGEFSWLRETTVPVLGICAGMQAIGKEFGAAVERMDASRGEIGLVAMEGKRAPFPASFEAFALHRNAVALPAGFEEEARSATCLQAFRKGNIRGVLFHPEVRHATLLRKLVGLE